MWKVMSIVICLSSVVLGLNENHDNTQIAIKSNTEVSSSELSQHCPDTVNDDLFSCLPLELKITLFELLDLRQFTRSRILNRDTHTMTSLIIPLHGVKDILLGDRCPSASDLIRVLRLLQAQPGPYPRLSEIFSKSESKRLVILYDRIQSLPLPVSIRDALSDILVHKVNVDRVRRMFDGLRRSSQRVMDSRPAVDVTFARSSQEELRKLVPDGLLDTFYDQLYSWRHGDEARRFAEYDAADRLVCPKVLELMALCGLRRITLWQLGRFVPDLTADQLESVLPFLTDSLWEHDDNGDHHPIVALHDMDAFDVPDANAITICHLPIIVEHYRANLGGFRDLSQPLLEALIRWNVPFLYDLLHYRSATTQDTLLHVVCKQGNTDVIPFLASQYDADQGDPLTVTNANGVVPFYYLRWDKVQDLKQESPDLYSRLLASDPDGRFAQHCGTIMNHQRYGPSLLLESLSESARHYFRKTLGIGGLKVYDQSCILEDMLDFYHNSCREILDRIRSQSDAKIRSVLMIQFVKHQRFPTLAESLDTADADLQDLLSQVQKWYRVYESADLDELRLLCAMDAATTGSRPDPITGITALHTAFFHNEAVVLKQLLSVDGVDLHTPDWTGTVPFQYASDWIIWNLIQDLPTPIMEAVVRSHPLTFIMAAKRALYSDEDCYLHLLFGHLHLFDMCVARPRRLQWLHFGSTRR